MKKRRTYMLPVVIATLLSAIMTTSCIDEDAPSDIGQETMLARFVISVGEKQGGSAFITKQTTDVTQAQTTPVFRGMQDLTMIPFLISGSNITTSDRRLGLNLVLPALNSTPQVDRNNTIKGLNAVSQSQVYQDVTITVGTNAFLCYGKAMGDDDMANGSLVAEGLENGHAADISFAPKAIYATDDPTTAPAEATAIADYLTSIANATGWSEASARKMLLLLEQFKKQHAGAAANVLVTVQRLYDAIVLEVGSVRDAIIASMKIDSGTDAVLHLNEDGKLEWTADFAGNDYPTAIGLPDGAACISWNETDKCFETVIDGTLDNVSNTTNTGEEQASTTGADLLHYAMPAPLYYRANTRIKVSNQSQLEHYTEEISWDNVLGYYDAGNGAVATTTRSVALQDPLQYAVGRLDAAVMAEATTLLDKENVSTKADDLELTGILVGGQYPVDYLFAPTKEAGVKPYLIYDNTINTPVTLATNIGKTTGTYALNHTLVLPSKEDEDVYIYLEFQNNSDHDITTQTGLVPPGCKLYLTGTIAPNKTTQHYVFEQDKVTTFVATIKNLQNATNVVPDMEVGLTFHAQVAIQDWDVVATEDHPIYNW